MVEPCTNHVTVESPPSSKLPLDPDFSRVPIPGNSSQDPMQRQIFLRPDDTVIFEDQACAIRVDVVDVNKKSQENETAAVEVQVKSSAQHSNDTGGGAMLGETAANGDDETDDEDDLDGPLNTPGDHEGITPATNNPTGGPPVKETPPRPVSRDSNILFSTALDTRTDGDQLEGTEDVDKSTPAARAGKLQGKRKVRPTSADSESQIVFGDASKDQNKYGSASKRNWRVSPKEEVAESPQKVDADKFDQQPGETPTRGNSDIDTKSSSTKRKRMPDVEEDDGDAEEYEMPASTLPAQKKVRGRPRKSDGRSNKSSKVEQGEEADPPSSSGLFRKPTAKAGANKKGQDEQDDVTVVIPRRTGTPTSSATPLQSKPPTKILLSKQSRHVGKQKTTKWLEKQGVSIVTDIPGKRVNFACVLGKGPLSTTAKLVRSLALGKKVVTDQWLDESLAQDRLLDLDDYIHDDLVETGHINRSKLFAGKTLFITDKLKAFYHHGFADIEQMATEAGATRIMSGSASKVNGKSDPSMILLGNETDDKDALSLVQEHGLKVYTKDLLTQSIIRGELLCDDDEFTWKPNAAKGKKRPKK